MDRLVLSDSLWVRISGLIIGRHDAWIITRTPNGCHLWTDETMQGPHWIDFAKQAPDVFWRTHEKLLADLAKADTERETLRISK